MSHDHARMSHASAPDDEATSGSEAAAGPQAAPRADRGARRGTYHVGPDRGWRVGRRRPGQEGPRLHRGEPLPRQMRTGMPYTFSLAQKYGYATNYAAIRHP